MFCGDQINNRPFAKFLRQKKKTFVVTLCSVSRFQKKGHCISAFLVTVKVNFNEKCFHILYSLI